MAMEKGGMSLADRINGWADRIRAHNAGLRDGSISPWPELAVTIAIGAFASGVLAGGMLIWLMDRL